MKTTAHQTDWVRVLLVLLMVLPVAVLFLLPGAFTMLGAMWLWLFLLLCFWMLFWVFGAPARATADSVERRPPRPKVVPPETIPEGVRDVMDVRLAAEQEGVEVFRGPLKEPPDAAFDRLKETLGDRVVPFLQEDEPLGAAVVVVPKPDELEARKRTGSPWIN